MTAREAAAALIRPLIVWPSQAEAVARALDEAGLLADPDAAAKLRDTTVRLDEQRRMTARAEQYAEAASDSNRANADRAQRAEARVRHLEALLRPTLQGEA